MASNNVSVTTGNTSNVVGNTSAIEHDEIVYGCPTPDPKPKPDPDKDCCCKTYHVVLNFN